MNLEQEDLLLVRNHCLKRIEDRAIDKCFVFRQELCDRFTVVDILREEVLLRHER